MRRISPFLVLLFIFVAPVYAKDNPWQTFKTPTNTAPRAIGDYSSGCLQGARALPEIGEGYQVMHPSRVRYFGHPDLVDFLQTLGRNVREAGLKVIVLGDMSQPRGGLTFGGHASHQNGLDVDIWFRYPKPAGVRALTKQEREQYKAQSILDGKTSSIQSQWRKYAAGVLKLAAQDERVERIFVNPIIKRELCAQTGKDRDWLRKIRPFYGHDDHLHVRLACPQDSPDCKPQAPLPQGDGCAELPWWFSEESQKDRGKAQQNYRSKVVGTRKFPQQCLEMLQFSDDDREQGQIVKN